MVSQEIHSLTEKLACDFMMATPEEPESLTGLLPVLKQLHDRCRSLNLKGEAESILKARKMINALLSDPGEAKMTALGDLIASLSFSLRELEEAAGEEPEEPAPPSAAQPASPAAD